MNKASEYLENIQQQKALLLETMTSPLEAASFMEGIHDAIIALTIASDEIDIMKGLRTVHELLRYFELLHMEFILKENVRNCHCG